MLDTIRADCEIELDPCRLMDRQFKRSMVTQKDASGYEHERIGYTWSKPGAHPHFVQYMPGVRRLKIETSLPKVIYGENVSLLSPGDSGRVLDEVSNRVSDLCGEIPHFGDWDLRGRIDACFAWRAPGMVHEYLQAFRWVTIARHYSDSVDKEATLYWFNSERRVRLYDKYKETVIEAAKDLLRFEVQLNHGKRELQRLGIASTRVGELVNWETAKAILGDFLDRLGGDLVISDDVKLMRALVNKCGAARARRLMGAIIYYRAFSGSDLRSMGFKREVVSRDRREVRKVGLSVGGSSRPVLPPLQLPAVYDGQVGVIDG